MKENNFNFDENLIIDQLILKIENAVDNNSDNNKNTDYEITDHENSINNFLKKYGHEN